MQPVWACPSVDDGNHHTGLSQQRYCPQPHLALEMCASQETSATSKYFSPPLSCHREAYSNSGTSDRDMSKSLPTVFNMFFQLLDKIPCLFQQFFLLDWTQLVQSPAIPCWVAKQFVRIYWGHPNIFLHGFPKFLQVLSTVFSSAAAKAVGLLTLPVVCCIGSQPSSSSASAYLTARAVQQFKKHKWPSDHRFWQQPLQWKPWTQLTPIPCL